MPESAVKLPVDDGPSGSGWTVVGEAASIAAALADSSDDTGVGTDAVESVFYVTFDPLPANTTSVTLVEGRIRASCLAGAGHAKIKAIDAEENVSESAEIDLTSTIATKAYVEIPCPSTTWTKEIFDGCAFGVVAVEIDEFEDVMQVLNMDLRVTYEVAPADAASQPAGGAFSRPYYRIHLTKDIKPRKVRSK